MQPTKDDLALMDEIPGRAPLIVAYGMGVDSTALLIGLEARGQRPDLILFADTGSERDETYAYEPVMQTWLKEVGFPPITRVQYQAKNFKNWPPYHSLGENCLTNATLPSLAFGFKSCSMKWKIAPQDKYVKAWLPAVRAWECGLQLRKMIGYDASPKDRRRYSHAQGLEDDDYAYEYPLIEWGWDREDCKRIIADAGLPVPPKSACTFCPSVKPHEVRDYKIKYLTEIIIMEARAEPRLRKIDGLWRTGCKGTRGATKRPGKITDFIREEGLLEADYIDELVENAPLEIVRNQERHRAGIEIPSWHDFLERFTPEDAEDDVECDAVAGTWIRLAPSTEAVPEETE